MSSRLTETLVLERDDVITLLQYEVDIACLFEGHLPHSARRIIPVPVTNTVYNLNRSGITRGNRGVTIAFFKTAYLSLLAWEPISPRQAQMGLKGRIHYVAVLMNRRSAWASKVQSRKLTELISLS